jgi:hypothetical protein
MEETERPVDVAEKADREERIFRSDRFLIRLLRH